jgi:superfamily I DNA and RNA helicase
MHTWGSSDQEGFLRYMSEKYLRKTYELSDSRNYRYSLRVFAEICTIFLRELKEKAIEIVPEFDAVLIDEAQDLIVDIDDERDGELLLFEEKQSFFSMVWKSLKPSSDKDTNLRRLIWAYDEAQSLDALKIPMYKEVFGETLGKELSRGQFYKGGTKKSEIMYKCYRSPKEVLLLAHILGMGLFRSKGMLSGLTSQRDWENLGYDVVSGHFSKNGNIVRLHRPDENSPHVIRKKTNEKLVNYHLFDNRVDEVSFIADKVSSLVNDDQISPERILVVCFRRGKEKTLQKQVANAFKKKFLNFFIPTAKKQNYFPTDWKEKNKNNFFSEGATTISFVPRAKGNEADIVFLVGLDLIAEKENSVQKRNELFVGITRTRGWLFLSGLNNNYSLYTELAKGCQCKSDIEFRYVRPKRSLDEEPQLSLF